MIKNYIEWFGWYGMVAIVGAYFLLSFNVIENDVLYQTLNLTGAIGIAWVSFAKGARQPGVLNTIWTVIALTALLKLLT